MEVSMNRQTDRSQSQSKTTKNTTRNSLSLPLYQHHKLLTALTCPPTDLQKAQVHIHVHTFLCQSRVCLPMCSGLGE